MTVYLGNIAIGNGNYLGNENITDNNIFVPTPSLLQNGLVFDFNATNYISGSTIWNSSVGNYTASVTGTVAGGLEYIDGTKVGFDGNKWLQFSDNMTASISSSQWQVFAEVQFTTTQINNSSFFPTFLSKGGGISPAWNYAYNGGTTASPGYGFMDGGNNNGGLSTDNFNTFMTGSTQLFALSMYPIGSTDTKYITINQYDNTVGNTSLADFANLTTSFSGSVSAPLLFGKSVDSTGTQNISGSVVRIFGYNRILNSTERQYNWNILTGQ